MNQFASSLLVDTIKGNEVKVLSKDNDNSIDNVIDLLSKEKIEEIKIKNPPHVFIEIVKNIILENKKFQLF